MYLFGIILAVIALILIIFKISGKLMVKEAGRILYGAVVLALLGLSLFMFILPKTTKISATNGDIIEFKTGYTTGSDILLRRWDKIDLDKKQYDIGDGLVYEHVAAFTDGERVIRCAIINYFPSQIPLSQLEASKNSLAYLFTEAGENYTTAVSEETEEKLNTYFTNYMNTYLTTPEAEEVGKISMSDGTQKPLYKYTVLERTNTEPYFEMYYCLYSDTKILAFFVNGGSELADITSGSTQANMDAALTNEEILSLLTQENMEAAIQSEDLFSLYMDNLITKIGGLPVLCGKDFEGDTDGMILKFAQSTKITDSGNELTLTSDDSASALSSTASTAEN